MHKQEYSNQVFINSISRLLTNEKAISLCSDNILIRKFNEKEAMVNQAIFEISILDYKPTSKISKRQSVYFINPDYIRRINYDVHGFVRSTTVLRSKELTDALDTKITKAFSFSIE